ncbi:hypothetical protein EDS67_20845 [candidate division KSB1 bacterium]|nr:MAG: hypothetical protein EDS67_20845 [candidate division KSB1 bacterium]MBC6948796.1 hypothetical protein [candidate division KSB1 bacterium]MCE7943830.1 hypothetical protein [Chlorobi bacterium CHB1]MDL1874609.1 hypothetical protein [Cytophagia bacterium CHB2]
MKLPEAEVELFYKLFNPLLVYAGQQTGLAPHLASPQDLRKLTLEQIIEIRNALYDQTRLFDSFMAQNPAGASATELEIVAGWKNFMRGMFYIIRYQKDYAVFLTSEAPAKAYGVRALYSSFEEMVGANLPLAVNTVLLPFKEAIICDGLISSYSMSFGSGIRQSLNEAYQRAKSQIGIITNFNSSEKRQSDMDLLKFYLRTQASREEYAAEIYALTRKSRDLLVFYHQEMGKSAAKSFKKHFNMIGIQNAWFGILEGMIIASGKTRPEAETRALEIVPADKRELVYYFPVNKK